MPSSLIRQPMPSPVSSNTVRKPLSSRKRAINTAFELKKEDAVAKQQAVKTKAGDYPIYDKNSDEASDFRQAFASARKSGKKKFTWQGRSYTTDLA